MSPDWKAEAEAALAAEDHAAFLKMARARVSRVIRFLMSRLYTEDETEKWKVIRALGAVAGEPEALSPQRAEDLLRRFAWALNDESGAVPYGVPEAIGEVLAVRPEFRPRFLPILCALLTEEDMSQTGPIEQGAIWAVGRVGEPAGRHSEAVVSAVRRAATSHADPKTRAVAAASLARITGSPLPAAH